MPLLDRASLRPYKPAEYKTWLSRGTDGFKPPNEASRKALEGEESLSVGDQTMPVEAGLRPAALDLSRLLVLDEVQAYVLLRRWVAKVGPGAMLPGAGPGAATSLSPEQKLEVAQLYLKERLHLLQSIEGLLLRGEREWALSVPPHSVRCPSGVQSV